MRLRFDEISIHIGPAVTEELPRPPHLGNHVEIQIRRHNLIFVARSFGKNLAPRIAKVTLPIELSDVPGWLCPNTVDGSHEVSICHCVRRLLELPQILAQSSDGSRGIEHNLRAVKSKSPGSFGKMPVVADIYTDLAESEVEYREAEIPGPEVKLLPEAWRHMGNVCLPVLAQILTVTPHYRCGVVKDPFFFDLIHRHHHGDA